jgi:hypothetical protein
LRPDAVGLRCRLEITPDRAALEKSGRRCGWKQSKPGDGLQSGVRRPLTARPSLTNNRDNFLNNCAKNRGREMLKTVVAVLALVCLVPVASASAQTAQATPADPAAAAAPPAEEAKICVEQDSGGNSRLGIRKICHTQKEWDALPHGRGR